MDRFQTPAPTTAQIHFKSAACISKWLSEDRNHPAISNISTRALGRQVLRHLREFLSHSMSEAA